MDAVVLCQLALILLSLEHQLLLVGMFYVFQFQPFRWSFGCIRLGELAVRVAIWGLPVFKIVIPACHASCRSGFIFSCKVVVRLSSQLFTGGKILG